MANKPIYKFISGPHTLVVEATSQEEAELIAVLKYKVPIYADGAQCKLLKTPEPLGYKLKTDGSTT